MRTWETWIDEAKQLTEADYVKALERVVGVLPTRPLLLSKKKPLFRFGPRKTAHRHEVEFELGGRPYRLLFTVRKMPVTCAGITIGGRFVMCAEVFRLDDVLRLGYAVYGPDDSWDPILGEKIALERALKRPYNSEIRTAIWRAYLESRGIQPAGGE